VVSCTLAAVNGRRRIDEGACRHIQCVVELIGQRWTGAILIAAARGARRFSEYRAMVDGISDRLLAVRLRELEAGHLIQRTVIPSTPVQIRYALTPVGVELVTALQPLMDFALRHIIAPTAAPRSGDG
jgi:DNA-binding HxlR family transcriptional regulator